MLKPSEVLMRAHNEGRKCGGTYSGVYGAPLCALGFLIEPYKSERTRANYADVYTFVSKHYGIPRLTVYEIEKRFEGWEEWLENPQPLNVIAEWLEGIGY